MTLEQKRILFRILLSALLTFLFVILPTNGWIRFLLFLIPYLIAGYDVLLESIGNIRKGELFDENFLMSVASIGAFFIGEYTEAATVMIFYQVGELFEEIAVGNSRHSLDDLMKIRPETARVIRNGRTETVPPEDVAVSELIEVFPGERIPLDGIVTDGVSSVNTSSLTGESLPVGLGIGDKAVSGTVNLTGLLRIKVTETYSESTVSRILEAVEHSASRKAKTEKMINRFSRIYTPCVVILAVLLAGIPSLFLGNFTEWLRRALIFLVVSCPCALVISVPLTFFCGIGGASRKGILLKGSDYVETLAKTGTFVFDKTGTLTKGELNIVSVLPVGVEKEELIRLMAAAESKSNHPIALSVCRAYGKETPLPEEIEEKAGKGIVALLNGEKIAVGNRRLMAEMGISVPQIEEIGSILYASKDGNYIGSVVLADSLRENAVSAVGKLKEKNMKIHLLSGDAESAVRNIAEQIGADEYDSRLLPDGKEEKLERILADTTGKCTVAYVGDGINDTPVLARADVGIAMGGLGSEAAMEAADVVLMEDNLEKLPEAVDICRKTVAIVRENIIFSLSVKVIILLLGAFGMAGMGLAVFGDVGVTALAVLNAMRAFHTTNAN